MGKRAPGALLVGLVAAAVLAVFPTPRLGTALAAGSDVTRHIDLFRDVLDQVRAHYVVKPDESKLLEDAIKGALAGLGVHSAGLSEKDIRGETQIRLVALPSPHQALSPEAGMDSGMQSEIFHRFLDQVRVSYAVKPNASKLAEDAIRAVMTGLDPHCSYLSPKEVEEEREDTRGGFAGLGVNIEMASAGLKVVEPLDNMPADRAGVLAGDTITAIDGTPLKGLTMKAAGDRLRGEAGSPVTLTLIRQGHAAPITVRAVRDIIRVDPVQYSVVGDVGWIRIKSFEYRYTADHVRWAVADIQKALGTKVSGYVLDLRNNPGGLLDQAIAVADEFLDHGAIVVTKGRTIADTHQADAKPGDITDGKPLVILINGGSASASEIVAGALQDNNRATLLGTRSFGKGSVQTLIPLVNKGAIRLTTARYYTPSGRSIQAVGIEPDYDLKPDVPQELKLELAALPLESEAQLSGHLKTEGAQERAGSSTYVPREKELDDQLNAAIALIHAQAPDRDGSAL
jgi:carboxyl-terminal processing protease